jgi:hypothetical protein
LSGKNAEKELLKSGRPSEQPSGDLSDFSEVPMTSSAG